MDKLSTFLKNFDTETNYINYIKIYNEEDDLIFDGKMGDVPQRISNMMSVVQGTAVNDGPYISVWVRKC